MKSTLEEKTGMLDAHPMMPELWTVRRAWRETYDTFSLEITPANGRPDFPFAPGQFNMLYAFGTGEAPISISSEPDGGKRIVHTLRAVGAVTKKRWDSADPSGAIGLLRSSRAATSWSWREASVLRR
jgi:hypothetical protein